MNEMKNAIQSIKSRFDQKQESVKSKASYMKLSTQRRMKKKEWENIGGTLFPKRTLLPKRRKL